MDEDSWKTNDAGCCRYHLNRQTAKQSSGSKSRFSSPSASDTSVVGEVLVVDFWRHL